MHTERQKGVWALVLLALIYSSMGIFVREMNIDFALYQQTYLRVFGAVIVGVALFWPKLDYRKMFAISAKDAAMILLRAAAFSFGVIFFTFAFTAHDTSYSDATFVSVFPLLPLLAYFLLGERLSLTQIAWIALGFVGVALVAVVSPDQIFHWGRGEVYAILSAIGFDLSYIARKWQSDYINDHESVIIIFFIEGLIVLVASFLVREPSLPLSAFTHPLTVAALLMSSLFNVFNLYLVGYGFKRVSASVGGNILTLETVFALLISVLLYAEIPSLRELAGGALIVLSVYQVNRLSAIRET